MTETEISTDTKINAKFTARAYIGKDKVELEQHHLVLQGSLPGTCALVVKGDVSKNAIVALELGWGESIERMFLGYVERVQSAQPGYVSLFCRELAGVLANNYRVQLRHPTMRQILDELSSQTGLTFAVPEASYTHTAIPCFYADSSGIAMLDNIGRAFQIKDFIWQQQGDGAVYVGSYQDSFWQSKQINIPTNLLTKHKGSSASMTVIPKLRPHLTVNGKRLRTIEVKSADMTLSW